MVLVDRIFRPSGSLRRKDFLLGFLLTLLLVFIFYLIPMLFSLFLYSSSETFYFYGSAAAGQGFVSEQTMNTNLAFPHWKAALIFLPGTLLLLYCTINLFVKRLRNAGLSTGLVLLIIVPYVNILMLLFLFFYRGGDKK